MCEVWASKLIRNRLKGGDRRRERERESVCVCVCVNTEKEPEHRLLMQIFKRKMNMSLDNWLLTCSWAGEEHLPHVCVPFCTCQTPRLHFRQDQKNFQTPHNAILRDSFLTSSPSDMATVICMLHFYHSRRHRHHHQARWAFTNTRISYIFVSF